MNFGQNLYNWFLSNAQSLVLMAIVVIGIYWTEPYAGFNGRLTRHLKCWKQSQQKQALII